MGQLVDGQWTTAWYAPDKKGRFVRSVTSFRNHITADGSSRFQSETRRYHLYVSYACPWAHRTLILRKLKKLEDAISVSVVDALMGDDGWAFGNTPDSSSDSVNGCHFLREVYILADAHYTGRVTVPVLWDRKQQTIVNNESLEIVRMFDLEFDAIGDASVNFYPESLRPQIDQTVQAIYDPINNGVYRCGFATTQFAYEEAVKELFKALDHWESHLAQNLFLCGDVITEADWCLFTTLIRFDLVYYTHFKCNLRHLYEYPNLWRYLKQLYQVPGVSDTCNFEHIKDHYYQSHTSINPHRIVPIGPNIDFDN